MSYFLPPLSSYTDKEGKTVGGSFQPCRSISLQQLYQFITGSQKLAGITRQVREGGPCCELARESLPFICPSGVFSDRRTSTLLKPSGLVFVDITGLSTPDEARALRDTLFADPYLRPALSFLTPDGYGVNLLVPYDANPYWDVQNNITYNLSCANEYVQALYSPHPENEPLPVNHRMQDIARPCLLCHDAEAKCILQQSESTENQEPNKQEQYEK